MKILHVITGLEDGGAESVLFNLCTHAREHTHAVVSLMGPGKYGPLLVAAGIPVHCLHFPQSRVTLRGLVRLHRIVETVCPDVVQTWMYHADLVGGFIAKAEGLRNIFWGIHNANLDQAITKRTTLWTARVCARLSWHLPRRIVCCAQNSLEVHRALGYDPGRLVVIHNGHDLARFAPDPAAGRRVRRELELPPETPVLGMVARFDPQKDHRNLLHALARVRDEVPGVRCLLVGRDNNDRNDALVREIRGLGLQDVVLLLDQRRDVPALMNALDLHVLSSRGEAFPNVLNEAMACGTPCVTTDVGDAAHIVGETGWVVSREDSPSLAAALVSALEESRAPDGRFAERRRRARERIAENFSLERMVEQYCDLWSN